MLSLLKHLAMRFRSALPDMLHTAGRPDPCRIFNISIRYEASGASPYTVTLRALPWVYGHSMVGSVASSQLSCCMTMLQGAAAFFAMREYEKHQAANGNPPNHQFAKEVCWPAALCR